MDLKKKWEKKRILLVLMVVSESSHGYEVDSGNMDNGSSDDTFGVSENNVDDKESDEK